MSQDLSFLEDESLTDNLSDDVAKQICLWLESLAKNSSPIFESMLAFTKAFNKAKSQPVSHKGKRLNDLFEIVLIGVNPNSQVISRFATYLIDQGAVNVTPEKS